MDSKYFFIRTSFESATEDVVEQPFQKQLVHTQLAWAIC